MIRIQSALLVDLERERIRTRVGLVAHVEADPELLVRRVVPHDRRVQLEAPGPEHAAEARHRRLDHQPLVRRHAVRQQQQRAASHHELIDLVGLALRHPVRPHQHQHVDVLRDLLARLDRGLVQLLNRHPGLLDPLHEQLHTRRRLIGRGQEPDPQRRLALQIAQRRRQLRLEPRWVRHELEDLFLIPIFKDAAEPALHGLHLAGAPHGHRLLLDALPLRALAGVPVGVRVEDPHRDLAVRRGGVFVEHVLGLLPPLLQDRRQVAREVAADRERILELAGEVAAQLGERVGALLGEVPAPLHAIPGGADLERDHDGQQRGHEGVRVLQIPAPRPLRRGHVDHRDHQEAGDHRPDPEIDRQQRDRQHAEAEQRLLVPGVAARPALLAVPAYGPHVEVEKQARQRQVEQQIAEVEHAPRYAVEAGAEAHRAQEVDERPKLDLPTEQLVFDRQLVENIRLPDEEEQDPEEQRADEGDDLVLGQRGDEAGQREVGRAEQQRRDVATDDRPEVRRTEERDIDDVARRHGEEQDQHDQARQELAEHEVDVAQRPGQQHLDGPELALLRPEPHGERRHEHDEPDRQEAEEGPQRGLAHGVEVRQRVPGREQEEREQNDIGHDGVEVGLQLARQDCQKSSHCQTLLSVSGSSGGRLAGSGDQLSERRPTSSKKASSRLTMSCLRSVNLPSPLSAPARRSSSEPAATASPATFSLTS